MLGFDRPNSYVDHHLPWILIMAITTARTHNNYTS